MIVAGQAKCERRHDQQREQVDVALMGSPPADWRVGSDRFRLVVAPPASRLVGHSVIAGGLRAGDHVALARFRRSRDKGSTPT